MNNTRWWRWITCWFTRTFWILFSYRTSRFGYLLLGKLWPVIRFVFSPLTFLISPWMGGCEIHYAADIGGGLLILHPSLGAVVSKYAVIGKNLVLTGGNCIGGRKPLKHGDLVIGDNVSLGANAVVLGPVHIGDNTTIGAGAVVVKNSAPGSVLGGVPARPIIVRD